MYRDNEQLILLESFGKPDTSSYVPEGSLVTLVKVLHDENDLAKSKVAVKVNDTDKVIIVDEVSVKINDERRIKKEFDKFNQLMMERNPELKRYHPNPILRLYYRIVFYLKNKYGNK